LASRARGFGLAFCARVRDDRHPVALKLRSLSLNLPFGLGGVQIDVSEAEVRAAWQLYVEFSTRVTAYPLEPGAGSVKEALESLHSLFATTRQVLRDAGPEVGDSPEALGPLAIRILNEGVRPFLVSWHTELHKTEARSEAGELADDRRDAFDAELGALRQELAQYVDALALIAGIRRE
jgi:hypothetical protein